MNQTNTKSSLTSDQACLVELMQALNFGRIEELQVRGGQPVLYPQPRVIQKVKMGADNAARPELLSADFRLKNGIVELLEMILRLRDGEVMSIEVRSGLPVSAEIEWPANAVDQRRSSV
jgi:hypothetical protein